MCITWMDDEYVVNFFDHITSIDKFNGWDSIVGILTYNLVVLQDAQEQEEPHLQEAPQQLPDLLDEEEEDVDLVVVDEFGPHIIINLI